MQGKYWTINANCCHKSIFADSLGGEKYILLEQHYKQMMPDLLGFHLSACGF